MSTSKVLCPDLSESSLPGVSLACFDKSGTAMTQIFRRRGFSDGLIFFFVQRLDTGKLYYCFFVPR